MKDILRQSGKEWQLLSPEEKHFYQQEAVNDKIMRDQ
jgi:hypothetical protein